MSPVFIGPPKLRHDNPATWRYRCNAPTPGRNFLNGERCGQDIDGWEREPMEGPPVAGFRTWEPGPFLEHRPCGHIWSLVTRTWWG